MPRRSILTPAELAGLLTVPTGGVELVRRFELSERDLAVISGHRGRANRLGFAVQLAYMRFPGIILGADDEPDAGVLRVVADQVGVAPSEWVAYGQRGQTRREHLVDLQRLFGFRSFTMEDHQAAVVELVELAARTDKGIVLAEALIVRLRERSVLLPASAVIERICAEAVTRADRHIYETLTGSLTSEHRERLDALLSRKEDSAVTWLGWLRQPAVKPNSRHIGEHLARLGKLRAVGLPDGIDRLVHQNRLTRMAREGGQMTPADLAKFEPRRRYATLVAVVLDATASIIDETLELHDRILGKAFATAKTKHRDQFHASGRAINDKVRLYSQIGQALVAARRDGHDPYIAIEAVIGWDAFTVSVTEATGLAQPESFDFLVLIGESFTTLRRYSTTFLDTFDFHAAPAVQPVIDAINVLRAMNRGNLRKVPADAPTSFITKRWEKLVVGPDGTDRRFYELCVMAELRNGLRSGDISVRGSRQYKDFDDYLIPTAAYTTLKTAGRLPVKIDADPDRYLQARVELLAEQFEIVNRLAAADELPDAVITDRLKIVQPDSTVPEDAQALIDLTAGMLPHVKITELLVEVDQWIDIASHFSHLKTGSGVKDKTLLFTTILADAINLGLTKMAEACPAPPTRNLRGSRPGTSATKPIQLRSLTSLTRCIVTPSPPIGVTAPHRHRTGSDIGPVAVRRAPGTST